MGTGVEGSTTAPPGILEATTPAIPSGSAPAPAASTRHLILTIVAIPLVVFLLALLLLLPWLPQYSAEAAERNRYQPLAHGQAISRVTLDAHGIPQTWGSENVISIPAWQIFGNNFPPTIASQLLTYLPELNTNGRFPPGTSLFRSRSRILNLESSVTTSDTYILRQPGRDDILAVVLPGIDTPLLYNPPVDLSVEDFVGPTSVQSGSLAGLYTYTLTTTQSLVAEITTPFGRWQDCRQIDAILVLSTATDVAGQEHTLSKYCLGQGMVKQTALDGEGNATNTTFAMIDIAATDALTVAAYLLPTTPLSPPELSTAPPDTWEISRVASLAPVDRSPANSIAPIYVAAPSPYLLAAARNGPLFALDAQQLNIVRWEFQTAGSIFSQPTVDPNTGRIYFGSSDKHFYALSGQGLFLWRVRTRDNIAAKPLILPGVVLVVSEDGTLYALNSQTGAERWQLALGSASIAAPAHLTTTQSELILIGSDDGLVEAIDVANGTVSWQTSVDGAIQAPLQVDHGTIFVATTSATVYALASSGEMLWTAEALAAIRTAPVLDDDLFYIVDDQGWLYAFTLDSGRLVWRSDQANYLGSPILLSTLAEGDSVATEILVVASVDGTLSAFSTRGELLQQWQAAEVYAEGDHRQPSFTLAPTFGGGALWLGDDHAVIRRLGPPITVP